MTSRDEALRALEKRCRQHMDGEGFYWQPSHTAFEALESVADELAAILSARQEVAPVAWGLMYPDDHAQRGQLWNVAVEKESAEQMQSACWNAGYDVIVPLYASPAHTSEARDAVSAELERAVRKFPTWPTDPLHAVAVLGEEFGELTKAVLQSVYEPQKVKPGEVRTEAVQTAAMALRFLQSLDAYVYAGCEQHSQDAAMCQEAE